MTSLHAFVSPSVPRFFVVRDRWRANRNRNRNRNPKCHAFSFRVRYPVLPPYSFFQRWRWTKTNFHPCVVVTHNGHDLSLLINRRKGVLKVLMGRKMFFFDDASSCSIICSRCILWFLVLVTRSLFFIIPIFSTVSARSCSKNPHFLRNSKP